MLAYDDVKIYIVLRNAFRSSNLNNGTGFDMLLENFASRPYPVVKVSRNEMNSVMELLKIFTYSSGAQATANVNRMLFIVPATGSQALGPWLTGRTPAIFTARGPKNTHQPLALPITPYLG
jgi:hypothetical protein